jgi:hypothetical protein
MWRKPPSEAGFRNILLRGATLPRKLQGTGCSRGKERYTVRKWQVPAHCGEISARVLLSPASRRDPNFFFGGGITFRQQEPSQAPQIIEDTPAGGDVEIELGEIVGDQQERFLAAFGAVALGGGNFGFDIAPGLIEGIGKQGHIFVRPFDGVKRRFSLIAHDTPFRPLPPR